MRLNLYPKNGKASARDAMRDKPAPPSMLSAHSISSAPNRAKKPRRAARWLKRLSLFAALFGALFAQNAWADCNISNGNINLGSQSSFSLANSGARSSGFAGISCSQILAVLTENYIGVRLEQAEPVLRRDGTGEAIPYILSWEENGSAITTGQRLDGMSSVFLSILGSQSGQINFYARTSPTAGLRAGTYRTSVDIYWYWSVCTVGIAVCPAYNNSTGLTRGGLLGLGAINNYGSGDRVRLDIVLNVTRDCALTVPNVQFGQAALPAQFPTRTLTINARCTAGETYKVGIDNGQNASGTTRRMISGSNYLAYDLWKGVSGNERWGNNSAEWRLSSQADDNPTLNGIVSQGFRFRAQVRPDQITPKGIYRDTVTVNVFF